MSLERLVFRMMAWWAVSSFLTVFPDVVAHVAHGGGEKSAMPAGEDGPRVRTQSMDRKYALRSQSLRGRDDQLERVPANAKYSMFFPKKRQSGKKKKKQEKNPGFLGRLFGSWSRPDGDTCSCDSEGSEEEDSDSAEEDSAESGAGECSLTDLAKAGQCVRQHGDCFSKCGNGITTIDGACLEKCLTAVCGLDEDCADCVKEVDECYVKQARENPLCKPLCEAAAANPADAEKMFECKLCVAPGCSELMLQCLPVPPAEDEDDPEGSVDFAAAEFLAPLSPTYFAIVDVPIGKPKTAEESVGGETKAKAKTGGSTKTQEERLTHSKKPQEA